MGSPERNERQHLGGGEPREERKAALMRVLELGERDHWSEQTNERTVRTKRNCQSNQERCNLEKLYFVTCDFVTLRRFDIEKGR